MESKKYSVAEVAEQRGVTERAIYKQIKTHAKALEGHMEKIQGKQWLDEYAVNLLKEASSNSAPVVVDDNEKEAMKLQIENLQKELAYLKAEHEADAKALRQATESMAEMIKQNNENIKLVAESKLYIEQRDNAKEEITRLQTELDSYEKTIFGLYRKK